MHVLTPLVYREYRYTGKQHTGSYSTFPIVTGKVITRQVYPGSHERRSHDRRVYLGFVLQDDEALAEVVDDEVGLADAALAVVDVRVVQVLLQPQDALGERLQVLKPHPPRV